MKGRGAKSTWPRSSLTFFSTFPQSQSGSLSEAVSVDLTDWFLLWKIVAVQETALAANILKEDVHRMHWTVADQRPPQQQEEESNHISQALQESLDPGSFVVTLHPMEIRTFLITVAPKA